MIVAMMMVMVWMVLVITINGGDGGAACVDQYGDVDDTGDEGLLLENEPFTITRFFVLSRFSPASICTTIHTTQ